MNEAAAFLRRIISDLSSWFASVAQSVHPSGHRSRRRVALSPGMQPKPVTPLLAWSLSLMLVVQTCALPIPLAFLLISADAEAMTKGCETETCCTPLCYLDKNGVHHCVHRPDAGHHEDSCKCGVSTHDLSADPILHSTPGTLPRIEPLSPVLIRDGWISRTPVLAENHDPATPSPPPK